MEDQSGKQRIEQMSRIEKMRHMQLGRHDNVDSSKNIIQKAVMHQYPNINVQEAARATRELVLAPKSASIKIGDDDVKVSDLQFQIAESIELLNSETTSSQEYFSWFDETDRIIQDMNDGFVSEDDLKQRNDWIDMSYTREAEMMTCLGLYQSSKFPGARKKYDEIYNKLVKVRQLRSSIRETTANKTDKPKEVNPKDKELSYKKAIVYVAAAKEFTKHIERWNMPKETLKKLKIYHGEDAELSGDYDYLYADCEMEDWRIRNDMENHDELQNSFAFDDKLKEQILFQWDDDRTLAPTHSYAEDFLEIAYSNHDEITTGANESEEETIKDRIARLSGRRPPVKNGPLSYDMDRARAFDSRRFQSLTSAKEYA